MHFLKKFWSRPLLPVQVQEEVLEEAARQAISSQLLQSPFLQRNVLNERFASTEGFSLIFREPERALRQFSALAPYLTLLRDLPATNLYYLNILVIGNQGCVERHVDHSIRGYGHELPLPLRVSVLYVDVPAMQGGRLLFYDAQQREIQQVLPRPGMLVHFDGRSKHAVEAVRATTGLRVSLVCEQYSLKAAELEAVPEFCVKSTADFSAYLQGLERESV